MASFKEYFEKQGGVKLIKGWWRAGVLGYAVSQLLLTGKSKKGLEILRLGVKMKIYNKLQKQYKPVLNHFDKLYNEKAFPKRKSNRVWFFWMQGMDKAPALVQRCYKSLQEHLKDREIILITSENLKDYVQFPSFIMEKLNKGIITYTHLSDLLRVELLIRYGGTWVDSTVFCSGSNIPDYMLNEDFFVFQNLRPGDNGSVINFSSWLMTSCSNNKMLLAVRELLYAYWEKNNSMIDYFLIHHFVMIVAKFYKEEWNKMIQFPNSLPHVLLLMLFEPFEQRKWNAVVDACPFHKLTYKRSAEEMARPDTYFQHIMNS